MTDRRLEVAMATVPVLLAALTLGVLLAPAVPAAIINAPLDVAIDVTGMLVAAAVAGLGWIRFREERDAAALLRASAFLALASVNAVSVTVALTGTGAAFGYAITHPGQLPLLSSAASRLTACALLLVGEVAGLRRWDARRWPALLVAWLPAIVLVALFVTGATSQGSLPELLGPAERAALFAGPTLPLVAFGARLLVAIQVLIGIGFLGASALAYRTYRRDRRTLEAFLAIGLMLAAFSQVAFAIHPGVYEPIVTLGDVLRLAFYVVMLVALAAESREQVRAIRRANADLRVLRDAELARATADERARLAREIHDGMSQELWFAKLKQVRLAGLELPPEGRELAQEVADALDAALAEARQAILALRPAEGASFAQVLERFLEDFSDRFGIRAEFRCDGNVDGLSARVQAELLRIAQEALTNARKHADPTLVRVLVTLHDGVLHLAVSDNGHGFDADGAIDSGYGLGSMRERAELIGGWLRIESGRQDGTRVTVEVPVGVSR